MIEYPKLSVLTITYGHEHYIVKSLDGVLMQNYPGEIEFIIANDNSFDNSDKIIKDYLSTANIRDNFIIKYTRHNTNKGINPNFIWSLKQATGKYIALCEGDDYWIDPFKLQKQVGILLSNPTVTISSHPSKRSYGEMLKEDNYGFWGSEEKIISAQEVLENYASTAPFQSIMFKNENIKELCIILNQLIGGHSTIQIFYSLKGGLYYLPNYMSVYRVDSSSSISKTLFKNDKTYLERQIQNWKALDLLNKYSNFKFNKEFQKLKRERAFSVFFTGYLTIGQKFKLIVIYHLYKEPLKLSKIIKSEMHSYFGLLKNRILNFISINNRSKISNFNK